MNQQALVPAGDHLAKVIDYAVTETQTGKPMIVVRFSTDNGEVFWNGVLQEAPEGKRNFTVEALIVMGMNSIQQLEMLADGPDSNVLNMEEEFSIKVVHEEYNGKIYAKAAFVNKAGGGKFKNAMDRGALKTKLASLSGLRADFAQAWQEVGPVKASPKKQTVNVDNIPF
jgi:hypothetical protein